MARLPIRAVISGTALVVQAVVLFVPRAPKVDSAGLPLDKLVHFTIFAAATGTLLWAGTRIAPTVIAMSAYAVLSEVIQAAAYANRSGEPADVVADLAGVAFGAVVGHRALVRQSAGAPAPAGPDAITLAGEQRH